MHTHMHMHTCICMHTPTYAGSFEYDLWCPCFDAAGSNVVGGVVPAAHYDGHVGTSTEQFTVEFELTLPGEATCVYVYIHVYINTYAYAQRSS